MYVMTICLFRIFLPTFLFRRRSALKARHSTTRFVHSMVVSTSVRVYASEAEGNAFRSDFRLCLQIYRLLCAQTSQLDSTPIVKVVTALDFICVLVVCHWASLRGNDWVRPHVIITRHSYNVEARTAKFCRRDIIL